MGLCSASYTITEVTNTGACLADCAGVSYADIKVTTSIGDGGDCQFDWEATRKPDNDFFSGHESVPCPGTGTVNLYCTDAKACVHTRIDLTCSQ